MTSSRNELLKTHSRLCRLRNGLHLLMTSSFTGLDSAALLMLNQQQQIYLVGQIQTSLTAVANLINNLRS